ILLYSIYIEGSVLSSSQQKLFYFDNVFDEFEKLITTALHRSSMEIIIGFYDTRQTYKMDDGDNIHRMLKTKPLMGRKYPVSDNDLPKTIYVRGSSLRKATVYLKDQHIRGQ